MIRSPLCTRYLALLVLSLCCSMGLPRSAQAQAKIELQTCEDLKITKQQYGAQVVETAACVNPTKTFRPKGTLRNVHILATFPAVPTRAGITFLVTETDAEGEQVQYVDYTASPHHTTAYAQLTINKPGRYFLKVKLEDTGATVPDARIEPGKYSLEVPSAPPAASYTAATP